VVDPDVLVAQGVTLVPAPGVGPSVGDLELRIDAAGLTQLGGSPVTAWQIPWRACRDVRTAHRGGVVVIALSFGALRYRWELPEDKIDGGAEAVMAALRRSAGARPMLRGLRGARRRR
jgi:hypothetical protein